jgi:hypothetical protein
MRSVMSWNIEQSGTVRWPLLIDYIDGMPEYHIANLSNNGL